MIIRERYLKKIRDFYNVTSLIKVLCGLRRSGKSVILKQIIEELKSLKIEENHIIYKLWITWVFWNNKRKRTR